MRTYRLIYTLEGRRESMHGDFDNVAEAERFWLAHVAVHPDDGRDGAVVRDLDSGEDVLQLDPIEPAAGS